MYRLTCVLPSCLNGIVGSSREARERSRELVLAGILSMRTIILRKHNSKKEDLTDREASEGRHRDASQIVLRTLLARALAPRLGVVGVLRVRVDKVGAMKRCAFYR